MYKTEYEELWWQIFNCENRRVCCGEHWEKIWPSPFFVGDDYSKKDKKVLFIAQNPGWPHDRDTDYKYTQENTSKFKNYFGLLMQAYAWELRVDRIWRGLVQCGLKVQLRNIAYTNMVKCPKESDTYLSSMAQRCGTWLSQEINLLTPHYIVFVGKFSHNECPGEIRDRFMEHSHWIYHTSGRSLGRNRVQSIQEKIAEINTWL